MPRTINGQNKMNTSILLDDIDLPETGLAEIQVSRSFTIGISAEQARRAVNRWLLMEVSMSFVAETPTLALAASAVWRVPIAYTASHVGRVGLAGTINVDVTTAKIDDSAELRECLFDKARKMASKLPPFRPRELPKGTEVVADIPYTYVVSTGSPDEIISSPYCIICAKISD
jgi:post-segregation antitoxin (ccd killing protein)